MIKKWKCQFFTLNFFYQWGKSVCGDVSPTFFLCCVCVCVCVSVTHLEHTHIRMEGCGRSRGKTGPCEADTDREREENIQRAWMDSLCFTWEKIVCPSFWEACESHVSQHPLQTPRQQPASYSCRSWCAFLLTSGQQWKKSEVLTEKTNNHLLILAGKRRLTCLPAVCLSPCCLSVSLLSVSLLPACLPAACLPAACLSPCCLCPCCLSTWCLSVYLSAPSVCLPAARLCAACLSSGCLSPCLWPHMSSRVLVSVFGREVRNLSRLLVFRVSHFEALVVSLLCVRVFSSCLSQCDVGAECLKVVRWGWGGISCCD